MKNINEVQIVYNAMRQSHIPDMILINKVKGLVVHLTFSLLVRNMLENIYFIFNYSSEKILKLCVVLVVFSGILKNVYR